MLLVPWVHARDQGSQPIGAGKEKSGGDADKLRLARWTHERASEISPDWHSTATHQAHKDAVSTTNCRETSDH